MLPWRTCPVTSSRFQNSSVVTENEAARRLYIKAGFIEYGHQINALKHGGRYYDDILMVKFLEG